MKGAFLTWSRVLCVLSSQKQNTGYRGSDLHPRLRTIQHWAQPKRVYITYYDTLRTLKALHRELPSLKTTFYPGEPKVSTTYGVLFGTKIARKTTHIPAQKEHLTATTPFSRAGQQAISSEVFETIHHYFNIRSINKWAQRYGPARKNARKLSVLLSVVLASGKIY